MVSRGSQPEGRRWRRIIAGTTVIWLVAEVALWALSPQLDAVAYLVEGRYLALGGLAAVALLRLTALFALLPCLLGHVGERLLATRLRSSFEGTSGLSRATHSKDAADSDS